jgi:hypothetical protein
MNYENPAGFQVRVTVTKPLPTGRQAFWQTVTLRATKPVSSKGNG